MASQLSIICSLTLSMAGVFTPWKLASTSQQTFSLAHLRSVQAASSSVFCCYLPSHLGPLQGSILYLLVLGLSATHFSLQGAWHYVFPMPYG
jgi:hypothetical protein